MASSMSLAMFTIIFLSFTLSQASPIVGSRSEDDVRAIYQEWLVKHQKTYNGIGEEERRFKIFKDNLKFIDEHNTLDRPYKVGLNAFADLTNQEYRAKFLGTRSDPKRRVMKAKNPSLRYAFRAGETLPESVDWRVKGAVNPIKNQGSCGCVPDGIRELAKLKVLILSANKLSGRIPQSISNITSLWRFAANFNKINACDDDGPFSFLNWC